MTSKLAAATVLLSLALISPILAETCLSNGQTGFCVPERVCSAQSKTPDPDAFCRFSPKVSCCPGYQPEPCQADSRSGYCVTTTSCVQSLRSPSKGNCPGPPFIQCCRPRLPLAGDKCSFNGRYGTFTGVCVSEAACADNLKSFVSEAGCATPQFGCCITEQ